MGSKGDLLYAGRPVGRKVGTEADLRSGYSVAPYAAMTQLFPIMDSSCGS
jgi:hypothetical protein